ncbi:hypothetical protein G7Y89_g4896 [Cudoniella acicularis]|uniref:Uncharacterized protein n=1 Tax=Cudoniella acicularis TaxID=354080 RepID=A0A8H4RQQ7_9HELO|nr:hypothetical protein G7Y89_g4896 [Cudoniella acicularis]
MAGVTAQRSHNVSGRMCSLPLGAWTLKAAGDPALAPKKSCKSTGGDRELVAAMRSPDAPSVPEASRAIHHNGGAPGSVV